MTIKDAYEIAKEKAMGFPLLETYETEDKWIFKFGAVGDNGMRFPGTPNVVVDKNSGVVSYITIPPIENLKIFETAQKRGIDWMEKHNYSVQDRK